MQGRFFAHRDDEQEMGSWPFCFFDEYFDVGAGGPSPAEIEGSGSLFLIRSDW